ncbi:MAG TPA: FkbM family methyltransferase [Candidatus Limnocylindria bacterium]|nr:FkbM family methyltransferase [Candidatus Limnocylindria bacterium]
MFIPADARQRDLVLDEYEPAVSARMRSLLRAGMTVCDVGANIGVFSLFAAKLVGPQGRVIAFEPIPANVETLRANILLNRLSNVTLLEKAAAETSGRMEIHLSSLCGCHSLVSKPEASAGKVLFVETVRLEELAECASIDLLKIDAEGAEIAVLRSLGARRPRHLILEYNGARAKAAGFSGHEFIAILRGLGYAEIENLDDPAQGLAAITGTDSVSTNLYASFTGRAEQ